MYIYIIYFFFFFVNKWIQFKNFDEKCYLVCLLLTQKCLFCCDKKKNAKRNCGEKEILIYNNNSFSLTCGKIKRRFFFEPMRLYNYYFRYTRFVVRFITICSNNEHCIIIIATIIITIIKIKVKWILRKCVPKWFFPLLCILFMFKLFILCQKYLMVCLVYPFNNVLMILLLTCLWN